MTEVPAAPDNSPAANGLTPCIECGTLVLVGGIAVHIELGIVQGVRCPTCSGTSDGRVELFTDLGDEAAELRELYLLRQEYLMGMHDTASQARTDRWAAVVDRYDALLAAICQRRGIPVPLARSRGCFTTEQRRDVEARLAATGFDLPFPAT